ncbi:UDP-N-acetylmuramoyl-L-alanyl-D-glutamate--2, 6-diaminopimelate ligase [Methylocella tundrae]|uniref:UDP-N-acetylmuramoyl-L-alanyl-D-glutamate--2,6-diaminopimelate ligase n=1 Tax=Methylocella tundrae TaxID=227605 RepID=A0A8B6M2D1_METTU|nr:UDP-N-acetylmuramoyl-L-alanyl-D-glutamate--2,6-diaminopimelate ligase [Methylocella tundrae]VTZ48629.1 UDP-N-acetylmuramoyl-L-alanyl-D-glutamate--2, 6-diaminopimelate ligase [Methylocella tundrae]
MRLAELLPGAPLPEGLIEREVAEISCDSRSTPPGGVFFAIPGTRSDGLAFAPQAIARGAIAVVAQTPTAREIAGAPVIAVGDVRAALAEASARLFPRQPGTIVAITGTSGKTSVAAFVRQIFAAQGFAAASLGTLGVVAPSGSVYGALTTPDAISLHRTLDDLAGRGVTHLALEASSHGIVQRRLDGVRLSAGAFTNLSRDHLDYHATMEDYLAAKLELFERLLRPGQSAVVDADSEVAEKVIRACVARGLNVLSTGVKGNGVTLLSAQPDSVSTRLEVVYEGRRFMVRLPLAGAFQASNALVAAGLCIATGSPAEQVFAALENLEGAPGRLERVGERKGAPVYVDYAHKPDALENVLRTLQPYVKGSLVVVFGCGGDRDAGKRPIMGEIAARLADRVIVTDDNPRSEDAASIRRAILLGAAGALELYEIGDRASAIREAVATLGPGDVLLIAGKGHETGQIIGDATLPFSDSDCARAALKDAALKDLA